MSVPESECPRWDIQRQIILGHYYHTGLYACMCIYMYVTAVECAAHGCRPFRCHMAGHVGQTMDREHTTLKMYMDSYGGK